MQKGGSKTQYRLYHSLMKGFYHYFFLIKKKKKKSTFLLLIFTINGVVFINCVDFLSVLDYKLGINTMCKY